MEYLDDIKIEFVEHESVAIPYDAAWINEMIPANTLGAYILLEETKPIYIGRSDTCLKRRLLKHNHRSKATHLIWQIAKSPLQAYQFESYWYQWAIEHGGFINQISPAKPSSET